MELSFGAVGKGWALDRVARSLLERGLRRALVTAGGSSQRGWGAYDWELRLEPGRREMARLRLREAALATSGAGEQHFEEGGRRYGHVLDPRTGWPAEGVRSASVLASEAAVADALSTAFLIGGPALAEAVCAARPGTLALFVLDARPDELVTVGSRDGVSLEPASGVSASRAVPRSPPRPHGKTARRPGLSLRGAIPAPLTPRSVRPPAPVARIRSRTGRSTRGGAVVEADREDAARLCRGDTSGLAGLMSRHQDRLFRYLLRFLGDRSVAEDVFQQAWLRAAERIRRYDAERPFAPWLVALARNLALDHLRRRRPASLDEADEPVAPSSASDPLELAMARQRTERVDTALGELGPLDREVLTLRFEDELTLPELALTLGVPLPTAKARLYRALERLRGKLLAAAGPGRRR